MTASLKRAIGHWATLSVEDLHAYADDLANEKHRYPSVIVTELTHDTQSMGCGKTEYIVRDEASGHVTATGKLHLETTQVRLTIASPSSRALGGQEIVDRIVQQLEAVALASWLSTDSLELTDPETDPPEIFTLESLKPIGRQNVPPETDRKPFLYRGALTLAVRRYVTSEREVEHVMKNIHVTEG